MGDWAQFQPSNRQVVNCMGLESIGAELRALNLSASSAAWPTANLALYVPFTVEAPFTAKLIGIENGGTASGNIDVGIYDDQQNRLVSKGSTAQSGTTTVQSFDITDTLLLPGLYYLGIAFDGTTGTTRSFTGITVPLLGLCGVLQQASAFPLPSPAVFAACATTALPQGLAIFGRTVV